MLFLRASRIVQLWHQWTYCFNLAPYQIKYLLGTSPAKSPPSFFKYGRIRSGVRASSLNKFCTAVHCCQAFENVLTYVNDGGDLPDLVVNGTVNATEEEVKQRSGWTVCGWVWRGYHDDQALGQSSGSNKANKVQVESSILNYHITSLTPSFSGYLDRLDEHCFDSSNIIW